MASSISNNNGDFHSPLGMWQGVYAAHSPGCRSSLEATWLMGERNVPQPDITLRILPEYGGQSRLDGDYSAGAPELIVEVAATSRNRDLGPKKKLYERMGVQEYIVAIPAQSKLVWHRLTPIGYQLLDPSPDGVFRSQFFPGLWLDPGAVWSLDTLRILDVLEHGLASAEHAAFVAQLLSRKK